MKATNLSTSHSEATSGLIPDLGCYYSRHLLPQLKFIRMFRCSSNFAVVVRSIEAANSCFKLLAANGKQRTAVRLLT